MTEQERKRYEVTFRADNSTDPQGYHQWSAVWFADDFAEAERLALAQLVKNGDNHSYIYRIEFY